MDKTIYFPVLYPMGSATFAIACSHCKNLGGGEVCTLCKQEKQSGFEIKTEPKGEWQEEVVGNGWNEWTNLICGCCGQKHEKVAWPNTWHYCPNCGAQMKYINSNCHTTSNTEEKLRCEIL